MPNQLSGRFTHSAQETSLMCELVLHATRANFLPAVSETTVFCGSRFAFRGYPGKKYVVNGCWLVRLGGR